MFSENLQLQRKEYKYFKISKKIIMDFISSRQYTSLSRQSLCTHDMHFRKIKAIICKEMQYIMWKPKLD